jgi:hypothetical protein
VPPYALSLDCVDCFTIGSESRAELADVVKKIPAASGEGNEALARSRPSQLP